MRGRQTVLLVSCAVLAMHLASCSVGGTGSPIEPAPAPPPVSPPPPSPPPPPSDGGYSGGLAGVVIGGLAGVIIGGHHSGGAPKPHLPGSSHLGAGQQPPPQPAQMTGAEASFTGSTERSCQTATADLTGADCTKYRAAAAEMRQGWAHFRAPPLYRNRATDIEFHVEAKPNTPNEGGIGTRVGEPQQILSGYYVRATLLPSSQYKILSDPQVIAEQATQPRDADGRQTWSWQIEPLVACKTPCMTLRAKVDVMARLGPNRFERIDGSTRVATVAVGVEHDVGWWKQLLTDLGDLATTGKTTAEAWIALIGVLFAFLVAMIARWRWLRGGAKGDAPHG